MNGKHELNKARACAIVMTDADLYQELFKLSIASARVDADEVTRYIFDLGLGDAKKLSLFVVDGLDDGKTFRVSAKDRAMAIDVYGELMAARA